MKNNTTKPFKPLTVSVGRKFDLEIECRYETPEDENCGKWNCSVKRVVLSKLTVAAMFGLAAYWALKVAGITVSIASIGTKVIKLIQPFF